MLCVVVDKEAQWTRQAMHEIENPFYLFYLVEEEEESAEFAIRISFCEMNIWIYDMIKEIVFFF